MSVFDAVRSMVTTDHRKHEGGYLCLHRCTECGYLAFTVGGLHGHIEGHRPLRQFWRIGWDVEWLEERTERMWLTDMSAKTIEPMEVEG